MSPRRKPGLQAKHLAALEHLPDVLEALEALVEQRERVAALTARLGRGGIGVDLRTPAEPLAPRVALHALPALATLTPSRLAELQRDDAAYNAFGPAASPILDTPERRAYEAAKKAGTLVPDVDPLKDPLRNASDAQRERMAEQQALVKQLRAQRGRPGGATAEPEVEPVRTEELPETRNGSTGVAEEPSDG